VRDELERRAINTVATSGGEFVPPLWLLEAYAGLARAGRIFADGFNKRPLPPGTNSINIPRITTGSAVAAQTADNAAVQSTDLVTTSLAAPVITIAGQEDMSMQLLEQSPMGMDELIFQDLIADYNAKLDVQALNGTGANGQALGLLNVSGINTTAYTDASPTVPEIYPKVADILQKIGTNRFLPATAIYMHPRRWGWFMAALDSNNRPLVVPSAQGPQNTFASQQNGPYDAMTEGSLLGLPVYSDANIPVTLNSSTQDVIIASRMTDHWLWEGVLRTRVLPEILSGTLGVRIQVYNYVALTAGRFPKASGTVLGTGTVTPTF
jgi:HK97 family phage major capsid protein